jgi:hypothetical protein
VDRIYTTSATRGRKTDDAKAPADGAVLFLGMYKSVLKDCGEYISITDNLPLFEYSLEQFENGGFELSED